MSRLSDFLIRIYRMDDTDETALARDLQQQMIGAWQRGIEDEARKFGCSARAKQPSGTDYRELENMATLDAASIAATYNRDVEREIMRLIAANPDVVQASFFAPLLEQWIIRRNRYKSPQIALNTETRAREIARKRFWQMNGIVSQFKAYPATAVCPICLRIIAAGTVSEQYTEAHPLPAHINCVHAYQVINPKPSKLNCKVIWTG